MKPLLLCLLFFSTISAGEIEDQLKMKHYVESQTLAPDVEDRPTITWKDWYLCKEGKPKVVIPNCGPDKIPTFQIGLTETGGIVTREVDQEEKAK